MTILKRETVWSAQATTTSFTAAASRPVVEHTGADTLCLVRYMYRYSLSAMAIF